MAPTTSASHAGDGVFSSFDLEFTRFLGRTAAANPDDQALVARNFLLDEGVSAARAASYREAGAVAAHGDYEAWSGSHKSYLVTRVFRASDDHGPSMSIDPGDTLSCPETFRMPCATPFATADGKLTLVRVERVQTVARISGDTPEAVLRAAHAALAPGATREQKNTLEACLETWLRQAEQRPVFAAFWEDVADIFGPAPAGDPPGWADQLRDRLGLAHLAPDAKNPALDVFVFRYDVERVPDLKGNPATRLLVPPSVLDGRHSFAFCPAPRGSLTGHTVDLGDGRERPCREVLHPTTRFRVQELFRVGTITRPVDAASLRLLRGLHLVRVRELSGRPDYGLGTDGDLQ